MPEINDGDDEEDVMSYFKKIAAEE